MSAEPSNTTTQASRRYGLTTEEALVRLHADIQAELIEMRHELDSKKLFYWLKKSLSFKSELSKMRWPSVLFMTGQVIAHLVVAFVLDVDNETVDWVGFQGLLLTCLLILNLTVNLWDTKLRFKELLIKSEQLLKLVKQCSEDKHLLRQWRLHNLNSTRNLFVPKSPSVHQTITYRDDGCMNLPEYLLVKGDIIHLFPGERAPCDCASVNMIQQTRIFLKQDEIFLDLRSKQCEALAPKPTLAKDPLPQFQHAKLKPPIKGTDFIALSTPYMSSLRISLQRSHKRPVNSVEKECFIISRKYFETIVIPLVFLLSTIITAIHYGYLDLNDSGQQIKTITLAYLLLRPSLTIMPFLPWMFPCMWLLVNAYGSARLLCCAQSQSKKGKENLEAEDMENLEESKLDHTIPLATSKFDNLLATPTAAGSSENKHDDDDLCELKNKIKLKEILDVFIDLIFAKSGHVWRSSNLLQVLGCLTSLCCIDKVGILSWSSPTPEKVCIIRTEDRSEEPKQSQSDDYASGQLVNGVQDNRTNEELTPHESNKRLISKPEFTRCHNLEVLDLSHSSGCFRNFNIGSLISPYESRLHFDDLNWNKYLNNLKPIGLAILMNNCCEKSFGDYFRFYRHISYESILRCNLTPVVKRRCLCTLARLIGFSSDALEDYKYMNQIGIYRLIDCNTMEADHLVAPSDNPSRLKLPFPSVTCNIQQSKETGSRQIFSHGTADLVLDACIEFWNGYELIQLDEPLRKKILDFYHRTSLTSYCSAFSYAPLLSSRNLSDGYLELPIGQSKFISRVKKTKDQHQEYYLQNQMMNRPQKVELHNNLSIDSNSHVSTNMNESNRSIDMKSPILDPPVKKQGIIRRHLSVENLDEQMSAKTAPMSEELRPGKSRKLNDSLDEITDQVFIGMVSTQYQACADFVNLVEQLEHACIRFVHFSKENELRSRVFSEKMGLESGWNCHISLQSDLKSTEPESTVENQSIPPDASLPSVIGSSKPSMKVRSVLSGIQEAEMRIGSKNEDIEAGGSLSGDSRTLYSWKSLPSLVMQFTSNFFPLHKCASTTQNDSNTGELMKSTPPTYPISLQQTDEQTPQSDYTGDQPPFFSLDKRQQVETGSLPEEGGFEALAYDMSNRAKLPKGIENIRPHLETVDNVPLQVSLFTDCTPELTKEMIEIMQDYGEIVCVIGCSLSIMNTSVFLQANASIAIEPLAPQSCVRASAIQRRKGSKENRKRKSKELHRKKSTTKSDESSSSSTEVIDNIQQAVESSADSDGDRSSSKSFSSSYSTSTSSSISSSSSSSSSTTSSSESSRFEIRSANKSSSSSSSDDDEEGEEERGSGVQNGSADNLVEPDKSSRSLLREVPDPSSLATKLASLPCCYSYNRKDPINLYSLIMEARHFTFKMRNTFVCMICFALSISSAQFLASLLFLPPMLSSGLTIWLTVVVVPLMSFSLMSTPIDSQVMKVAVGKNLQLKPDNITFFVMCYLIKFIPSIIVVVLCFGLIIDHSCKTTGFGSTSLGPCWMFTYVQHGLARNATQSVQPSTTALNNNNDDDDDDYRDGLWSAHLLTGQACAAFLLVLYFVVISAGFVHRSHLMWQRSPTRSHVWVAISVALLASQLACNQLILHFNLPSAQKSHEFLASLPTHIWIISFAWPVLVIGVNLLVKRAEIKATIRQQRRARFDFNTKLGMNSPF